VKNQKTPIAAKIAKNHSKSVLASGAAISHIISHPKRVGTQKHPLVGVFLLILPISQTLMSE
jgi:hypothetical protein